MSEAVAVVKAGQMSLNKASQVYLMPYSTLQDRVSGRVSVTASPGAETVLTPQEETKLKTYLIACSELGVGKSKDQVRELAYMVIHRDPSHSHYAERWLKHTSAEKDWYYGFMSRHLRN